MRAGWIGACLLGGLAAAVAELTAEAEAEAATGGAAEPGALSAAAGPLGGWDWLAQAEEEIASDRIHGTHTSSVFHAPAEPGRRASFFRRRSSASSAGGTGGASGVADGGGRSGSSLWRRLGYLRRPSSAI